MEYTTIEDKRARVSELREALERQATAFPGVLPEDEQVHWDADQKELETLSRDLEAWDARQEFVERMAGSPRHVETTSYVPPKVNQINVKSEREIYDLTESGYRSVEERNQTWRDDAMRATEKATFPHPHTDEAATRDKIATLLEYHDSPDKELARRIKATGSPVYRRAFEKIVKGEAAPHQCRPAPHQRRADRSPPPDPDTRSR